MHLDSHLFDLDEGHLANQVFLEGLQDCPVERGEIVAD